MDNIKIMRNMVPVVDEKRKSRKFPLSDTEFVKINNVSKQLGFKKPRDLMVYLCCGENSFIEKMAERGIACNVHYKPLPMLSAYKNLGFDIKDYPNAYDRFTNEITLPLHTKLSDEDVEYIIENFKEIISCL